MMNSMTTFANTTDVQSILYNNIAIANPMNATIATDTLTFAERIRLNLQCDLDIPMHGLLGIS